MFTGGVHHDSACHHTHHSALNSNSASARAAGDTEAPLTTPLIFASNEPVQVLSTLNYDVEMIFMCGQWKGCLDVKEIDELPSLTKLLYSLEIL